MKKADVNALVKGAVGVISAGVADALAMLGDELMDDARLYREYRSFTGQTLTGISYAVSNGGGKSGWTGIKGLGEPLAPKIRKGEKLKLEHPYEGWGRTVTGRVDIYGDDIRDDTYGSHADKKHPVHLMVLTNTEYSKFLEDMGLNVLTDTRDHAKNDALSLLKKYLNAK